MICHLPVNSHASPKNVCVIGGGDGGVLRELVKYDEIESITLCEIDEVYFFHLFVYLFWKIVILNFSKNRKLLKFQRNFYRSWLPHLITQR